MDGEPPITLWRDLHDRHWMLVAFRTALHFYAGRNRRHLYVSRFQRLDHPNLFGPPEFVRLLP